MSTRVLVNFLLFTTILLVTISAFILGFIGMLGSWGCRKRADLAVAVVYYKEKKGYFNRR